jgi:DNA invertase Pin-like site-specific DNA recombinase
VRRFPCCSSSCFNVSTATSRSPNTWSGLPYILPFQLLGRSMTHLVHLIEQLRDRGVGFRSLGDGAVDTTTASGELVFHIFSAFAQFERRLIQERTRAGLAAARARGRKGGRRPITPNDPRVRTAKTMHQDKNMAVGDICKTLGISRSTFYRYLALSD